MNHCHIGQGNQAFYTFLLAKKVSFAIDGHLEVMYSDYMQYTVVFTSVSLYYSISFTSDRLYLMDS